MAAVIIEGGERKNLTATGTVGGAGWFLGVFVSQASNTPTLKVADTNGTIINTLTPEAGRYYPCPCRFSGDLTVTISGTVDATVCYSR